MKKPGNQPGFKPNNISLRFIEWGYLLKRTGIDKGCEDRVGVVSEKKGKNAISPMKSKIFRSLYGTSGR